MPLLSLLRRTPVTHACLLLLGVGLGTGAWWGTAQAQTLPASCRPDTPTWVSQAQGDWPNRPASTAALPGQPATDDPILIEADQLSGVTGESLKARGRARLRRGVLALQADTLSYQHSDARVKAQGHVLLTRDNAGATDVYQGRELDLDTEHQDGHFLSPRFYLGRNQAGGQAERVDFIGRQRLVVSGVDYSSCDMPEGKIPPWVLSARRVRLDFGANDGVAEGAVLRFYGVPILSMPVLSFPVTEERKSGWLPPQISASSNTGFGLTVPYYWNIAPNLDATISPTLLLKRGTAVDLEGRYRMLGWSGEAHWFELPHDRIVDNRRWATHWTHRSQDQSLRAGAGDMSEQLRYQWDVLRVSDNQYWKDGLPGASSLTPRLLSSQALAQQRSVRWLDGLGPVEQQLYARLQQWQVLQDSDPTASIESPYQRTPQLGVLWRSRQDRSAPHAWQWSLQTEFNHFTHPAADHLSGNRVHALGQLTWPLGDAGWRVTPKLSFNAASYQVDRPLADGRTQASRFIPSFSLDSAWTLERETRSFGRALLQTLEPRLLYAYTPWRDQSLLPNFDSAALDFNATTVFSENVFSGIDRVSDAHQITAGLSTRFLDPTSGAELVRLGIAQRYLLSKQHLTADGVPLSNQFSDVLIDSAIKTQQDWSINASAQFNPDTNRLVRTITSVRYHPGPQKTLYVSHRLKRDTSEQLALGWQWPLSALNGMLPWRHTTTPNATAAPSAQDQVQADLLASRLNTPRVSSSECQGRLYGVGALDYSLEEKRLNGAIIGLEYDAGCWIGRLVARRQSTSSQAASTQLMLQLELIGLSRLNAGSNPLSILKDNIPGYQLLRDPQAAAVSNPAPGGASDNP